jgi:hypothetical protein
MVQEIIVCIIAICVVIYILRRIFGKGKKDSCNGCTACSEKGTVEGGRMFCDCSSENSCPAEKDKKI